MRVCRSHLSRCRKGFTLAECIIAMTVLGIILSAAAGLAFAMNSAERVTDDMGESQAHVRYATVQISELIRNSNMVFVTSYLRNGIAVWTDADDDGRIDGRELVYVEYDLSNSELDIVDYPTAIGTVTVGDVESGWARYALQNTGTGRYTEVVFNCDKAVFSVGDLVSIQFTTEEDGRAKSYQISARQIVSMDYLLDWGGELKSGDDDL